jgi:hypothetical protein
MQHYIIISITYLIKKIIKQVNINPTHQVIDPMIVSLTFNGYKHHLESTTSMLYHVIILHTSIEIKTIQNYFVSLA